MHRSLKRMFLLAALLVQVLSGSATAVSVTGDDWFVHFNLPDQSTSTSTVSVGKFDIRDALLSRINALQSNDDATLATYTFSAQSTAGLILEAISNALDRSATVRFIGDYTLDTNSVLGGTSLGALAGRVTNPLVLVKATKSSGIMHDKVGLFCYGGTNRWVFTGSWNFTSGASYQEWNIAIEAQNDAMYTVYSNEMSQLLAGHFHYDPTKSHAYDGATFQLADSWSNGWVRFSPPANGALGATNAHTDIVNLISNAQQEIVFALNECSLMDIATAIVVAANRGVVINGSMPESDTSPGGASDDVYSYLTNTVNYATTNTVHFITAYAKANGSALDAGQTNLIHEKYMVIDPWSEQPTVILGSPNWSKAALVDTNQNDENIVFMRHKDIARMYYAQFKRMTGVWQAREDFWCDVSNAPPGCAFGLWMTDSNSFRVEQAAVPAGPWTTNLTSISGFVGHFTRPVYTNLSFEVFRAARN